MRDATRKRLAVAYVPVIHRGYLHFFNNARADELYVLDKDLLTKVDYIRKDLRALEPKQAASILKSLMPTSSVTTINSKNISKLDEPLNLMLMPDEDISREIAKSFKKATVRLEQVFLRWDRRSVEGVSNAPLNEKIITDKKHRELMQRAVKVAAKSSDIWRRVGAVLITKNGRLVGVEANQGEPSAHTPWIEGDPRNIYKRGVGIELSLFIHAEALLISKAAKDGISLDGACMYVTTFPCPACAKLIAHSGLKNLYYNEGYAVLDGQRVLEENGVKLARVLIELDHDNQIWVPYKK